MMALKLACFLNQFKFRMLLQGMCFRFFGHESTIRLRGSLFPGLMKNSVLMEDCNTGLKKWASLLAECSNVFLHSLSYHSALITQKEVHLLVTACRYDNASSNWIYWGENFVRFWCLYKQILCFSDLCLFILQGPLKTKLFFCCVLQGHDRLNLNFAANITLEILMDKPSC